MNAAVTLLERALPATVSLRVQIPATHPSASILGTERNGSGTVVDPSGLILTVNYIVLGAAQIDVTLFDGTVRPGTLAAQDFATGIALVRVAGDPLPAVRLRSSHALSPGDEVFLMASAGERERRVSNGCVMAIEPYDAFWEYGLDRAVTTTALNPGLGGGALFDRVGQMAGVVSLDLNTVGRSTLAIPVEYFVEHRDELLRHRRRVTRPARAWVGFYCYDVRETVVIAGVLPGAPADVAGLQAGDLVVTVNDEPAGRRHALYRRLWSHTPGDVLTWTVYRNDKVVRLSIATTDAETFFA
jgi:S1-C subfamily serine protease